MGTVRYTSINGEVIAEKRDGVRKFYVPDGLGSTVALLDNNQAKTDTFGYWPYGEESSRTGTTATPFRFVGTLGYFRDSAARTYVRARFYKPEHGKWMTEDPLGLDGGDLNFLRYVANRPTLAVDPSGTQTRDPQGFINCINTVCKPIYADWKLKCWNRHAQCLKGVVTNPPTWPPGSPSYHTCSVELQDCLAEAFYWAIRCYHDCFKKIMALPRDPR